MGVGFEEFHAQTLRTRTEVVARPSGTQHRLECPVGRAAVAKLSAQLGHVVTLEFATRFHRSPQHAVKDEIVDELRVAVGALTAGDQGQPGDDVLFAWPLGVEQLWGVVRDVADRLPVKGQVVVAPGQRRRRRQDHIGVTCRLVEIRIDRNHHIERGQGGFGAVAVGDRASRIARHGHENTDLAGAGSLDLLRQRGNRKLALCLGATADPRRAATGDEASPRSDLVGWKVCRVGPHHAARLVEVAGQDGDHVGQPRGQGSERHRVGADPPVDRRGGCCREFAGDATSDLGSDPGRVLDRFGRERRDQSTHVVDPVEVFTRCAGVDQVLVEQDVGQRRQPGGVAAGSNREVLVGGLGGFGAARVDHHEPAATLLDGLQAAGEVGGGCEAAVRLEGVGAQHEQVVGPVEVGHGEGQRVAVQESRRDVARHLVDRARRVDVPRAQRRDQRTPVDSECVIVHGRVALVDRHRLTAILLDHREHQLLDLRERLVPGHLHVAPIALHHGQGQAVGVFVELLEGRALGADESV